MMSKAFAAKHGPTLSWTEWKGGFFPAIGAKDHGFLLDKAIRRSLSCGGTLLFAGFASFRQILELFIVEEKLFSGGKNKVVAAIHALQHSVLEFHGIPFRPNSTTTRHNSGQSTFQRT